MPSIGATTHRRSTLSVAAASSLSFGLGGQRRHRQIVLGLLHLVGGLLNREPQLIELRAGNALAVLFDRSSRPFYFGLGRGQGILGVTNLDRVSLFLVGDVASS